MKRHYKTYLWQIYNKSQYNIPTQYFRFGLDIQYLYINRFIRLLNLKRFRNLWHWPFTKYPLYRGSFHGNKCIWKFFHNPVSNHEKQCERSVIDIRSWTVIWLQFWDILCLEKISSINKFDWKVDLTDTINITKWETTLNGQAPLYIKVDCVERTFNIWTSFVHDTQKEPSRWHHRNHQDLRKMVLERSYWKHSIRWPTRATTLFCI